MKKAFFLPVCLLLFSAFVRAQFPEKAFYFRGGVSLFTPWHRNEEVTIFPGFTLAPGIRTVQNDNFAFTVSIPITIGATFKSDAFLGIDLPLMGDISFGSATGNNGKKKTGGLIGGGLAYLNVVNNYESNDRSHTEFWGYRFHAGVSFAGDETGTCALLLASFGKSMDDTKAYVIGLSIQFIVGNK
jgi:hypothetical protein